MNEIDIDLILWEIFGKLGFLVNAFYRSGKVRNANKLSEVKYLVKTVIDKVHE